jgi:hypothetical protein
VEVKKDNKREKYGTVEKEKRGRKKVKKTPKKRRRKSKT